MASKKNGNTKNQKAILIGVLCLAGGWMYWHYILKPVNKDIQTLRTELEGKQKNLDATRQAAMEFEVLEAEYNILKIEASELEKKLPFKKDLPKLISDITKSLEKNRMTIQSFTPSPDSPKTYFSEMIVSLQVSGTYHNLAGFLADIGQYDRIINTYDVTIMPLPTSKLSSDTISASLRLVIYIGK